MLLPPTLNGLPEILTLPDSARMPACPPLTYRRMFDPSYVIARCVHVLTASGADPVASMSTPPVLT